jgi:hypothetical protein
VSCNNKNTKFCKSQPLVEDLDVRERERERETALVKKGKFPKTYKRLNRECLARFYIERKEPAGVMLVE